MRWLAAAIAALVLGTAAPSLAQEDAGPSLPDEGWWVVLRAVSDDPAAWDDVEGFAKTVAPCGVEAFGDFSAKFSGFRPGFVVTVHMVPFPTKAEAEALMRRARACVPDAYVKYGRYAGE